MWKPPPSGKHGRQPRFSDEAIQMCLTMKVLLDMQLRQTTELVQSLVRLVGLEWRVPGFSTLGRRHKTLKLSITYRDGTGPLKLLTDSTGNKAEGVCKWNARKHGVSQTAYSRRMRIRIDEATLELRVVEVTGSNIGDAPIMPDLLTKSRLTKRSVPRRHMCNDPLISCSCYKGRK